MIQKLMKRYPEPRGKQERQLIEDCVACLKRFDFKTCYQMAQRRLKD
jgi:hypothetical protein